MLFWICVVLMIIGIVLWVLGCNKFYSSCMDIVGMAMSLLGGFVVLIMLIVIIGSNVTAGGYLAANNELYKSLIYKANTEAVRDEFGIINKEYIDEVQNWNISISKNKKYQRDFWIGIFYPNIYDDFEIINLEDIKFKGE
jgi:hypothetical protein